METWKPIIGYPDYEISDFGRVKSLARLVWRGPVGYCLKQETIRAPTIDGAGYPMVTLGVPKKSKHIHRLVAEAFLGPCPQGCEVRHFDGDKTNPKLNNLLYGTRGANIADAYRHGTRNSGDDQKRAQKAIRTKDEKYGRENWHRMQIAGIKYARKTEC